ncbi:CaiB/BaiF CoA transferase family protein [Rhodobium gokarnense]|uniref:Alpha-methylacyl-CoA racemase n=1 Tax=Rhodobium gokarnense TaxID=364296 RepID=A0ABT3HBQ8_9HYPH|nr:CaiB/BaiF CoA-transferase family protein [Rhodobium gokarnense]MCW2307820.1 alpha-methylacyl-CoA racemase [Rhodobium gokarnense]
MGPLSGIRIVEFAGIGPGPFAAMLLSDMGADVVRIDRKGGNNTFAIDYDILNRGRRSIELDLKSDEGRATALALVARADGLIEGFRPGVMEKIGLGPDTCLERNPRLVYGRMTGWGQEGPLSGAAGHDINYIALTGVLSAIGVVDGAPVPPLNLVGDFGGGALYLAFGLVCGLLEAKTSGRGQVVDAAIVDGAASLMAMIYGLKANGKWRDERGGNFLDGGAHFYRCYRCADGKWISVGAIEPKFYALLLERAGIDDPAFTAQLDTDAWPDFAEKLDAVFATKTREEWCTLLEGTDACFAPVLDMAEAPRHPHNAARGTFVARDGVVQPAPAPRFSRTPGRVQGPPPTPGADRDAILSDWGVTVPAE